MPKTRAKDPHTLFNFKIALTRSRFLSLNEWSQALDGISHGRFYEYTRGQAIPRIDTAMRIAQVASDDKAIITIYDLWGHLQYTPVAKLKDNPK